MKNLQPKIPAKIDPLAKEMLDALRSRPDAARHVILGGGFALKHYLDHRETADIDGKWSGATTPIDQKNVIENLRSIAREMGERHALTFKERVSKVHDIASFELHKDGKAVFAFKIAARGIELEPPITEQSPWAPIPIETLQENVASKMSALLARGAPRDFEDIRRLTEAQIISIDDAWRLWSAKNPGTDMAEAKKQVARHMRSIELRRPLNTIPKEDRAAVAKARRWVYESLTRQTSESENERSLERSQEREGQELQRTDELGLER